MHVCIYMPMCLCTYCIFSWILSVCAYYSNKDKKERTGFKNWRERKKLGGKERREEGGVRKKKKREHL